MVVMIENWVYYMRIMIIAMMMYSFEWDDDKSSVNNGSIGHSFGGVNINGVFNILTMVVIMIIFC